MELDELDVLVQAEHEMYVLVLAEHEMYVVVLAGQEMFVGDVVDGVDVLKVSALISLEWFLPVEK